ncbi:MAG: nucleotidyltransferase family protein [Acidobacteriota bacterium]
MSEPPPAASLGAVIPAAGRSRRMGREKVLLPFQGSSSLEAILRTLDASGVRDVSVVLRADLSEAADRARRCGARVVVNPDPDGEMIESIRLGLAALAQSAAAAVFVWPADHPAVSGATIDVLSAVADAATVWIPTWEGRRGHPALLGRSFAAHVFALGPGEGLRELWRSRAASVRELPVPDPGVVTNIDTPAQYAAAVRDFPGPDTS